MITGNITYDELVEFIEAVFGGGPESYDELPKPVEDKFPINGFVLRDENKEVIYSYPPNSPETFPLVKMWLGNWAIEHPDDYPHIFKRFEKFSLNNW